MAGQRQIEKSNSGRRETLIIQTAFLGDLLLGIPFFRELRVARPQDHLTLLCRQGLGSFMRETGLIDTVIEVDKGSPTSRSQAENLILQKNYSLLISPHESFRSNWLSYRVNADRKIGFSRFFNHFVFDDRLTRPMDLPEALRQLSLLAPLSDIWERRLTEFRTQQSLPGGQASAESLVKVPGWAEMEIPSLSRLRSSFSAQEDWKKKLSPSASAVVEGFGLQAGEKFVVLAPGSVWATKMWTLDGFVEVAREFLAEGTRVVVMGSEQEQDLCAKVVQRAPGAVSIAGETKLFQSAEILALAHLLVSNDSGAMHLAAAAGCPTVSVFGPTILEFGYRPWQSRARVLQVSRAELPCRPCGTHGAKTCPLGTHDCMKKVNSAQVLSAAKDLLRS